MNTPIAIIDLGTNTCNLLIAKLDGKFFEVLYQGKEAVKLGKNGIDKNQLTIDGLERAVIALKKHQELIERHQVSEIVIIATSAIREATNRDWFQKEIELQTGLDLTIISGEKEADLIFKGVKLAFHEIEDHSLILDIGGGSNEFILTSQGLAVWKESFPIGMARIIDAIPPSNPIKPAEIDAINYWFDKELQLLWNRAGNLQISQLIGCSGAFDTIADLIDETHPGTKMRIHQNIKLADFEKIYEKLIYSSIEDRRLMKGMDQIRNEMIVPAILFIKLIIDRLSIPKIVQTDYALREGVLYERIFS